MPRFSSFSIALCLVVVGVASVRVASAQPVEADAPAAPRFIADLAFLSSLPAALETGQSLGVAAGWRTAGTVGWGVRASWSQAAEHSLLWAVTQSETRVRGLVSVDAAAGRGRIGARVLLGGTAIYESRQRAQAGRLGDSGRSLADSAWAFLPGGEVQVGVTLPLALGLGVSVFGGPSLHGADAGVKTGWAGELALVWVR